MSLQEKLEKIKLPNLESQQHTAIILSSIEDTILEQGTEPSPVAYFAALLALLRQTLSGSATSDLAASAVYLLDVVAPFVPASLLRSQVEQICSILVPLVSTENTSAPLLKSSIGCFETLLLAQDGEGWALPQTQISPRNAMGKLLLLAIDERPKVRKRAQEALKGILGQPLKGPSLDHPSADFCANFTLNAVVEAIAGRGQRKMHNNRRVASNDPAVSHALQLTKAIATASRGWPSKKIEALCEVLLSISRSTNEFLVTNAFEVFEVILQNLSNDLSSAKIPPLLDAILDLNPARNDSQLVPPWIAVLSRCSEFFSQVEPDECFSKVPELFNIVATYLTSPAQNIRISASECLISFLVNCIPSSTILEPSIYDEKILQRLGENAAGLLAVKYQSAWMEIFNVLDSLFGALKWRGDPHLLPILRTIGDLRGSESFQGKKEADQVLGHAISGLGPQVVLSILPLNLIKPQRDQPGRVWLLPLLRDHVSNTNLAHFRSELVPLSENMYQRVLDYGPVEKTTEMKIFETVIQQIWATFPGYCDLPLDMSDSFDQPFAELLSNLLYKETPLRPDICRGLQNLVESNQAIIASDLPDQLLLLERRTTKAQAEANLSHLATLANNMLAVLFNVYSETAPQHRAYILQCIDAYLSITPKGDLVGTFDRVLSMLEGALPKSDDSVKPNQRLSTDKSSSTSHTLLDLVITISTHLPRSSFSSLFSLASQILTNSQTSSSDPQLVKKAYKLIPRLVTCPTGVEALKSRNAELQSLILSTATTTPIPARRDRLLAINILITFLPSSDLHFIPCILSEVVLACKDANEKARQAGFELIIHLANKIKNSPAGTVIQNGKVPHLSSDALAAQASLEEVFTMVSAGLAGVAPHMIAASIAALSRLLFEFHAELPRVVLEDLVNTIQMFLQSNNREIVRNVLGFVKVAVVVVPDEVMASRMPELVTGMMVWSKENKGRLRAKVKGILDRCIRKFGAELVEKWVGEKERKMVVNLRKTRERSKRKKKGDGNPEEIDDEVVGQREFDNKLDEVLGSDSDDSVISSDGEGSQSMGLTSKSKKHKAQFLRDDGGDEPVDLLGSNALANVSSTRAVRFKDSAAPPRRKSTAKVNEDGKLIFNGNDADWGDELSANTAMNAGNAVNAYAEAVSGEGALRVGQKGRLKAKQQRAGVEGEKMDLDEDEARQVAKSILQGRNRSKLPERRGLGVQKARSKDSSKGRTGVGKVQTRKGKFPGNRGKFRPKHGGRRL